MMSRFDNSGEDAYAFVGGFLNCGYIAGYVRNLELANANSEILGLDVMRMTKEELEAAGDHLRASFFLQQTNNINTSLPCLIKEASYNVPKDVPNMSFPPSKTLRGHFLGRRLSTGERIADFRVFRISEPDFRDMPMELPPTRDTVDGAPKDFREKKLFKIANDEAFEKKAVVKCLNNVRISGFLDSWAFGRDKNGNKQNDCIVLSLRQTANPEECIPLRLYGSSAMHYTKHLQTGVPLFIEGEYRVKVIPLGVKDENGVERVLKLPYIHCGSVKRASFGTHIKVSPPWWYEMRDRLLAERKARAATVAAKMAQEGGLDVVAQSDSNSVLADPSEY